MANDRLGADEVPLTHEFLSFMMGSRRAGVTVAIHALAQKGLVENRRGAIKIVNRLGLEAHAGRYYGIPEREYKKLIPSG